MLEDEELTFKIRGCIFEVFRVLGAGFLEKVYEKALLIELEKQGLKCKSQHALTVNYKGAVVGEYLADIFIEDRIVVELKAVNKILSVHEAQLLNYLKATNMKIGLLVNFTAPRATVKRFISS
jgi:GxxExxY protein